MVRDGKNAAPALFEIAHMDGTFTDSLDTEFAGPDQGGPARTTPHKFRITEFKVLMAK